MLNEWGDFFAGFFAPLAFLWLVLGYLQQGDELHQNTQALELQAAELRSSVEQQTQLVETSRLQLQTAHDALRAEREALVASVMPVFTVGDVVTSDYSGGGRYQIKLKNAGHAALDVDFRIEMSQKVYSQSPHKLPAVSTGEEIVLEFYTMKHLDEAGELQIWYVDAHRRKGHATFALCPSFVFRGDEPQHTRLDVYRRES